MGGKLGAVDPGAPAPGSTSRRRTHASHHLATRRVVAGAPAPVLEANRQPDECRETRQRWPRTTRSDGRCGGVITVCCPSSAVTVRPNI